MTTVGNTREVVTAEQVGFLKSLVGRRRPVLGWNRTVTREGIERFARGVGDDNPLWWDENYARHSPLGGITAPSAYLYSHGNDMLDGLPPGSGPFINHVPDTIALWAGENWHWLRPVRMGEVITCEQSLADVRLESGGKLGAVSLTQVELEEFRTADGELVAEHRQTFKRFAKQSARRQSTYDARPLPVYTAEDRERFDAHYAQEQRRGSEPRYIEDVIVGDLIAPMLKGPLTLSNLIGFMLGWGSNLGATNRVLAKQLTDFPEARIVNPTTGAFDGVIACHWDRTLAQQAGLPDGYDFGCQRSAWIAHFLTDWAGDHGFLAHLEVRLRRPNILNDVTWITGRIVAVDLTQETATVAISAVNQLGEETAIATGVVRLPSSSSFR